MVQQNRDTSAILLVAVKVQLEHQRSKSSAKQFVRDIDVRGDSSRGGRRASIIGIGSGGGGEAVLYHAPASRGCSGSGGSSIGCMGVGRLVERVSLLLAVSFLRIGFETQATRSCVPCRHLGLTSIREVVARSTGGFRVLTLVLGVGNRARRRTNSLSCMRPFRISSRSKTERLFDPSLEESVVVRIS